MQKFVSKLTPNALKIGDVIHGYKLEKLDYIRELNIRPYHLRHEATGAEHLHIQKEGDSNNVFAVNLRTVPKSSNGVAHILEHLTLAGSKKYAVREPFFKMTTRSLATFMNAMTGPDFTVYPFSTQNSKDFENLLSVYTDAVFFPRLRPVDFRQEGWRLEHEVPEMKDTPIILKGVVYNEMKGVFSSSSMIYSRKLLNNLFPDTTYRHESGGDPHNIPDLSHEELTKFHRLHYHPSNAKFFTYGDIPLENHLKLINEMVLSKFNENPRAKEMSVVEEQPAWDEPRTIDFTCPPDPAAPNPDKQTTTSISFVLPTTCTNHDDMFALQILSSLLLDGPNAPFYKNLIESGLGADYSSSTGFGNYTKQPYFSVGLQNISQDDVGKVHKIIEDTFTKCAIAGFPSERVDAILHNIELSLKHVTGNFGLRLLMGLGSTWNHECDIMEYFKVNKQMDKFKQDLATDKDYWNKLIKKHFLDNNHKLISNMSPDKSFEEKRTAKEKRLLESKISGLNDVDKQTILYEGMELKKIQNTKDDPNILPCLEPSKDISKELSYKTKLVLETYKGVNYQLCEQPTNEVVYFRALADVGDRLKDAELVEYLPIFCDVATKLGAGSYNRHQLAQRSQMTTGGLGVTMTINPDLQELDKFKNEVFIGSHCLRRNIGNMFELWTNIFQQIHFQENKDYLHQLIKVSAAELAERIPHAGNAYAIKKSLSSLTKIGALDERLSGLTHVARMKDMSSKEDVALIAEKLQQIATIAFDPFEMRCAINAEPDAMESIIKELSKFIDNAQAKSKSSDQSGATAALGYEQTKVEDMKFQFATHYVAKSLIAVPRLHPDYPKLVILSKLISSKYLLREVREKGGAYGAKAAISNAGTLSFSSYRDPNTNKTLKVFDSAAQWIEDSQEYNERDIEESKLGVFQDVDQPVPPGRRGLNYFTMGETDEMRQEFRRRLLEVTKDDVVEVASGYLKQEKSGIHIL